MKRIIPLIFFTLLIALSCTNQNNKKFVTKYYPTGEVLSKGWYAKDDILIDTFYQYYQSGKVSAITVYDAKGTGKQEGLSIIFHRNGNIFQQNNFTDDMLNGFAYQYTETGKLMSKTHWLNDVHLGDSYGYDTNTGKINSYSFYHNDTTAICNIQYDSLEKVNTTFDKRKMLIKYGTKISKSLVQLSLVLANPPKCNTKVRIGFLINDVIVKKDSFVNEHFATTNYTVMETPTNAKVSVIQYDSTNNKYYYFTCIGFNGPIGNFLYDKKATDW